MGVSGRIPTLAKRSSIHMMLLGSLIAGDCRSWSVAAFSRYGLWIADYSKSSRAVEVPTVPNAARWTLWQFTSSAKAVGNQV